jgi:hypothetical protein
MTKKLLRAIAPEIDKTLGTLKDKVFDPDPIVGKIPSKITSIVSSVYKRHGTIIEKALLEIMKSRKHLVAWSEDSFWVSQATSNTVQASIDDPDRLAAADLPFVLPPSEIRTLSLKKLKARGWEKLQIDVIVFDKKTKTVSTYEVKRGFGKHDAGKRKQILRELLTTQVLIKKYTKEKIGITPKKVRNYVVFYYDKCSIPPPAGLKGSELDVHFDMPVRRQLEKVNALFKKRVRAIITRAAKE